MLDGGRTGAPGVPPVSLLRPGLKPNPRAGCPRSPLLGPGSEDLPVLARYSGPKKTGACAPEAYFAKLFRPHRLTPGPGLRRESIWGREPSLAAAQIGPEISRSKLVEVPLLLRLRGRFLRCQRPAKSMRCGFLFISGGQKGHNGRIRHQSHKNECEKNIVHGDL